MAAEVPEQSFCAVIRLPRLLPAGHCVWFEQVDDADNFADYSVLNYIGKTMMPVAKVEPFTAFADWPIYVAIVAGAAAPRPPQ